MPKAIALDFGLKRTGIAVTDDLKIIASGLTTIQTTMLMSFLKDYFNKHIVDELIIGQPKHLDGKLMALERNIVWFIKDFQKEFPKIKVIRVDERFTSKIATQIIVKSELNKKRKQNKSLIDKVSATLLLQAYLYSKS